MPKKEFHEVTYAELTDAYVMITDDGYYHISFTLPTDKVQVVRSINVSTGRSECRPPGYSHNSTPHDPASSVSGTTPTPTTQEGGDHPAGKTTSPAYNHSANPTPKHTDDEDVPF